MSDSYDFFATCAAGFEQLLAGEISNLSISSVRALRGQVAFTGSLKDAYRVCMWSRIASSVVVVLSRVDAANSDELYASIKDIVWEEHLPTGASIAIDAHGKNDALNNTRFITERTKDAICDRLREVRGSRPNVDRINPDVQIVVRLRNKRATCGISLSGTPLFKRGALSHAKSDGLGNMRPDYAAAFLAAGGWYRCCRKDNPVLIDMYSGSGAVLIEAASVALDIAPGLERIHWGFEHWLKAESEAWDSVERDAKRKKTLGAKRAEQLTIAVFDDRPRAVSNVRHILRSAGIELDVQASADIAKFSEMLGALPVEKGNSLAVADLSWFGETELVAESSALATLTQVDKDLPSETPFVTMSASKMLDYCLTRESEATHDILIKQSDASIRYYTPAALTESEELGGKPSLGSGLVTLKDGTSISVLVKASDQFAARLAKVAKERAKWAKREDVSCYRIYDADLPDYAVAIDLYQGTLGNANSLGSNAWLYIQEYEAPKEIDKALAHRRLLDVLSIAPRVLHIDRRNVFLRTRRHAKGGSQYADGGAQTSARQGKNDDRRSRQNQLALPYGSHLVEEGGLEFEVNFSDYLDTGLFLDHRDVRAEIREYAKQTKGSKRFLNLFAYTGTATCYAADGGAKHTTTVDLSTTYLDWARRNMERNGFVGPEHEYVRADVVRWVSEQRHTPNRWDLVFCDPPTFSNSKRMSKASFDVQRDHAELLIGISRLLTANGMCVFSCNLRGFKPDIEKLAKAGVQIKDVTAGSIPEDFKRNAKIHHCYLVRRTPRETA